MRKAVIRRRQGVTSKPSRSLNCKVYHIAHSDRISRPIQKELLVITPQTIVPTYHRGYLDGLEENTDRELSHWFYTRGRREAHCRWISQYALVLPSLPVGDPIKLLTYRSGEPRGQQHQRATVYRKTWNSFVRCDRWCLALDSQVRSDASLCCFSTPLR